MTAAVVAGDVAKRAASKVPPVVTWALLTAGVWLVYTAVRGLSPRAELTAALTGSPSPGPTVVQTQTVTAGITASGRPVAGGMVGAEPELVALPGKGSHKLAPAAAAAFQQWQFVFGAAIPITDSYRSNAQQADAYARAVAAGQPDRFAPAGRSWHERGLAVDVNLSAIGASPTGSPEQRAVWQRLYSASVATGWCNPRGPGRGDQKEPWHFSYGGCG